MPRPDLSRPSPCTAPRRAAGAGPGRTPQSAAALALALLAACGAEQPNEPDDAPAGGAAPAAEPWPEEAAARGLAYANRSGEPAKRTVLEAGGAGVALIDLGGDGDLDVVFGQGLSTLGQALTGPGADLAVFANDGDARFAAAPGPGLAGWWTGLATGDVDGDGDADLVAGAYGDLALCLQDAAGALVPHDGGLMAAADGVPGARLAIGAERDAGAAPWWATSLALCDLDRDGYLDLYVGQYLELDPVAPPVGQLGEGALALPCAWKGHPVYCGPRGMTPQPDRVLRGDGRGGFTDVTAEALPGHVAGYTLGVQPFDADLDGDTDLYVANDSVANLLLQNDGGVLRDVAPSAGVAFNQDGAAEAGMGVAFGDVDRDGRFDLVVTNFSDEPTQLFLRADLGFRTETYRMGLGHATRRLLSWGVHLEDFDGDGGLDLFTGNGHVYPQADAPGTGTTYAQRDTLWRLGAKAVAVEPATDGSILAVERGTRGSAVGDLDGDGAPELVLAYVDAPAGLGMNRDGAGANRLLVRLLGPSEPAADGPRTPADGTGAVAVLIPESDTFALLREVQTAAGYQSASSPWLRFGLGGEARYAALEVRWPSGRVERLPGGAANRRLVVREGEGVVSEEPLR